MRATVTFERFERPKGACCKFFSEKSGCFAVGPEENHGRSGMMTGLLLRIGSKAPLFSRLLRAYDHKNKG
jgi:hypothetical protein